MVKWKQYYSNFYQNTTINWTLRLLQFEKYKNSIVNALSLIIFEDQEFVLKLVVAVELSSHSCRLCLGHVPTICKCVLLFS